MDRRTFIGLTVGARTAGELAGVVCFVGPDRSACVHGPAVVVDGGPGL